MITGIEPDGDEHFTVSWAVEAEGTTYTTEARMDTEALIDLAADILGKEDGDFVTGDLENVEVRVKTLTYGGMSSWGISGVA